MLTAAALLLQASANAATASCAEFIRRSGEPVQISTEEISAATLGAKPLDDPKARLQSGIRPRFGIGPFTYHGYGITIRSSDPRFAGIRVGYPSVHRCNYEVDAPGSWNAGDPGLENAAISFRPLQRSVKVSRGSVEAAKLGAMPVLKGYKAGASWPLGSGDRKILLGLMHSSRKPAETLIVSFAARPGPSTARVLARLPLRFTLISVMPDIHSSNSYINLDGHDPAAGWHRVVLQLTGADAKNLAESQAQ